MPKDFTNLLPAHAGRHSSRPGRISGETPRRTRQLLPALAIAAGLLLTTACGSDSGAAPFAAGTPKPGGSMTMYLAGEARSLDPFRASYASTADGNRMSALYDMLVWTNPRTGAIQPQIAESLVPTNAESSKWRLVLRPGVKFSDGEPYNAEAVRINWERHRDPQVKSQQAVAVAGVTLRKTDDLTLEIDLPSKNANFDRMVARHLSFIASPKAIAAGNLSENPVGAGPFVLPPGGWVKNDHMTLKRNPNYWQGGKPYLNELTYRIDSDVAHSVKQIDAGKGDVTVTIDPLAVKIAKDGGLGTEALQLSGGQMLSFNVDPKKPFGNRDARRAVALSLSGAAINERVFQGAGTPARGIFASSSELANNQLAAQENNPKAAADLWNQITQNGSRPFTATLLAPQARATQQVVEYVAAELSKYPGVSVKLDVVDIGTFIQRSTFENTYDIKIGQLWIDDPEPSLYNFLMGPRPAQPGQPAQPNLLNCCNGYNNPVVNAALQTARESSDPAARRDAYTAVQLEMNKDMPVWVYQESVSTAVFAPKYTGVALANDGALLFDRIGLRKG